MDATAAYTNFERPTEVTKFIEEMNVEDFNVFVHTIMQDEDSEKQRVFAKHLVSEKFWSTKTQQFIRIVSIAESDLAYFLGQYLWDDYNRSKMYLEFKVFAPGLYACFYQRNKLKLPTPDILIPEFFFGQLLIKTEENSLKEILFSPKHKKKLRLLLEEEYDEITELAKEKWVARYSGILSEILDSVEDIEPVKLVERLEEEKHTTKINTEYKPILESTHSENLHIEPSKLVEWPVDEKRNAQTDIENRLETISINSEDVVFLTASTDSKLEIINGQKCLSDADELLLIWINSAKDKTSLLEIVDNLIIVHQAFGLDSQNAMLIRASTLCYKRKLSPAELSEILLKLNLIERYFDYYPYLQSESNILVELVNVLLSNGESEQAINGLIKLSNHSHSEVSVEAAHLLISLIENKHYLVKPILHRLKGQGARLFVEELTKRFAEMAAINKDISLQLSEKDRLLDKQKIYTLQELGESIKDIIRTMETKAADLIRSGNQDNYFIHFVQMLRRKLSRSGLMPIEELHKLGSIVDIERGIHIKDGTGEAPFILKSLGLKSNGSDHIEFIIDYPRVESNNKTGEVDQDA
ncbi:hypothetical protein [Paenibacillus sacheonensis]|uniref:Uncharacterized protein n=1 Tax=Paenibacillus sacheonensis TaxID=742054 RepID=A0A7X5C417_9BACL|nr:hypothetical protein [Paenibacillus sacheonensis]MBM7568087.1 hypothetical protein [Paenibacillus sacheonensis]NBC72885.1 hypothetical protein [Paenibacillus sacheonensis]